jgi:hypothetical protein
MDRLPPESAYRLALLLSRDRGHLEDRMVQAARSLSPVYAFMPTFLLHHWCHEVISAVLTTLIEADLRPVQAYVTNLIRLTRQLGRSPDLIRALVGAWSRLIEDLIDAECAAAPDTHAELTSVLRTLLALADQAIAVGYSSEGAAHELLHHE